ncbi:MAG: efflux RND transporter periplasmic adaptor subunit [Hyphomicrobiaceae bacterium]|nr:efflux RND transporter periplasmic adaptor subunit [Hyphomicrobiaceae bacterium]
MTPSLTDLARRTALALPLLCAVAGLPNFAAAAERSTVAEVEIDDAKEVVATVESVRTPTARARLSGTIVSLDVVEGDQVKAGQVLATIVDAKQPQQIAAYDAKLVAYEAKLALLKTELDRTRSLRATGAVSQSRLDDAETELRVTNAEIAATRAERAVVIQAQTDGRVLAPADGRVLRVQATAGQVIMNGEPLFTLATAAYVLKLRLPERHARFMNVGDAVFAAERGLGGADGGKLAAGRIAKVYPELTNGQVVADAEVAGLGNFFVGERVRVAVSTGKRKAILLPASLIVHRAGLSFARVDGVGEVPVQTGRAVPGAQPGLIEILTGLKPGDVVLAVEAAK